MNICGCGASAGYPHKSECPYPLFRGSENDWDRWERALGVRMLELEEAGRNAGRISSPSVDPPDNPQPPAPREEEFGVWLDCCKARGRHRLDCPGAGRNAGPIPRVHDECPDNDISDEGELDAFELEPTGQLSIGVDGEQRAIPGLAPAGKPAPLNFERDETEQAAREQVAGLVTIADHGKTIEAGGISFTIEVPASARARAIDPMAGRVNYDPTRGA